MFLTLFFKWFFLFLRSRIKPSGCSFPQDLCAAVRGRRAVNRHTANPWACMEGDLCGRDRRGGGGGGADRQKFTHRRQNGHLRWSAQPAARLDISFSSRKTSGVLILERPRAVRRDKYVLSDGLKFPLFLQSDSFTPPVFPFYISSSHSFQSRRLSLGERCSDGGLSQLAQLGSTCR